MPKIDSAIKPEPGNRFRSLFSSLSSVKTTGQGFPTVTLSNSAATTAAAVGDTVGTIQGPSTSTYTLTNNASGKFSLVGLALKVAGTLLAGVSAIAISAVDASGWSQTFNFDITVSASGGGGVADPNRYMFASTRLTMVNTGLSVPLDTQLCRLSKMGHYSPDYPVFNMRPVYVNAACDGNGSSTQELDPSNAITIDAACLAVGTTTYPITFGGNSSVSVPVGATVVGDAIPFSGAGLPARSKCFTITHDSVLSGQNRPGGLNRISNFGEAMECSATPQLAKVSATATIGPSTGTSGGTNNGTGWAPVCWIAQGYDGREVVLIHGDSMVAAAIDIGNFTSPAGCSGWVARGLDSTASGSIRMPHLNLGLTGSRPSQMSSRNPGAYQRRGQMFDAIRAVNAAAMGTTGSDGKGLPPFTTVFNEGINNDTGITAGNTVTGLKAVMQGFWDFLRAEYPSVRIIQSTAMPNSQDQNNARWTDYPNQVLNAANDRPSGGLTEANMRWGTSDWYKANVPNPLFAVIDVASFLCAPDGCRWKLRPFATTTAAAVASGQSDAQLVDAPTPGDVLVIDYGTASWDMPTPIISFTGSGPYVAKVNGNWLKAHASGALVKSVSTIDGAHASPLLHQETGDAVIVPAKLNGTLRISGAA